MTATSDCNFAASKLLSWFYTERNPIFNINNKNARALCEISSKLVIKTQGQHNLHKDITRQSYWRCSGVFIYWIYFRPSSIVDIEQVNADWDVCKK